MIQSKYVLAAMLAWEVFAHAAVAVKDSKFVKSLTPEPFILPSRPDTWTWGMAPIYDDAGRVHIFNSIIDKKGSWLPYFFALIALFAVRAEAVTYPDINSTNFPAGTFVDDNPTDMNYRYFVPIDYDANDTETRYPLVLFLHGGGGGGSLGAENSEQLTSTSQKQLIFVSSNAPDNQSDFPCFFVAPQSQNGSWENDYNPEQVIGIVEHFLQNYPVDPDRVYITGMSQGGAGTLDMINFYPDYFAAAAPICGWSPGGAADAYAHIPTWLFHSADDPTVSVGSSETVVQQMRDAGGHPIFTRYDTGGHGSWKKAYSDSSPLVEWMMSQRRGQAPTSLVGAYLKVTSPTSSGTHTSFRQNVALSGVADSEVTSITYLNDAYVSDPEPVVSGLENWSVTAGPLSASGTNKIFIESETIAYGDEGNGSTTLSTSIEIEPSDPMNQTPIVSAGSEQFVRFDSGEVTATLTGTVSDDDLPEDGALTYEWSLISGPESALIANPTSLTTQVEFSELGIYVFRLTADDDDAVAFSELTVSVIPEGFSSTVRFDLGSGGNTSSGNWNNLTSANLGASVSSAVDATGLVSSIGITVTDAFKGINTDGILSDSLFPENAVKDSFYIPSGEQAAIEISGLDTGLCYQIRCFASRSSNASRTAIYTIGEEIRLLDAANNVSDVALFESITSDENGLLTLEVEVDEGSFGYLGVLEITPIPLSTPTAESNSYSTSEGSSIELTLEGSAAGSCAWTFELDTAPQNGILEGVLPNITYTPSAGFTGVDSFTFHVDNGVETSAVATIDISVNALLTPLVQLVGNGSGFDLSGDEVSSFRSSNIAKSLDADDDDVYGSAGYFFYGNGVDNTSNSESRPSWISAFGTPAAAVAVHAHHSIIDNPTAALTGDVVDWVSSGHGYTRNDTPGQWEALLTFSVDASAPSEFRLGVMAGNLGGDDGRWNASAFRILSSGAVLNTVTGLDIYLGMIFFDITLPSGFEGTFSIEGETRDEVVDRGPTIAGIVFDIAGSASSGYADWLAENNITEGSAEIDNDGIDSLLEYVLNGDPTISDQGILPTFAKANDSVTFSFSRRASSTTYTQQLFQYSYDLITWEEDLALTGNEIATEVDISDPVDGVETISISLTPAPGKEEAMFGRLKVIQQ